MTALVFLLKAGREAHRHRKDRAGLQLQRPHVGLSQRGKVAIVILLLAEVPLVWLHAASHARPLWVRWGSEQFIPGEGHCYRSSAVVQNGNLYVSLGPRGLLELGYEIGRWPILCVTCFRHAVGIEASLFVLHSCVLLVGALVLVRAWRRRAPVAGRCAQCDYDLQGLVGTRCPECGAPFRGD